jgi:pyruvate formate lyase activating enzyme
MSTNDGKGLIFHIIHGSFVDGPGIRTTVFLKGCPLACLWCCNPEGQKAYPELKVTASSCTGCGKCVGICPVNAISVSNAPGRDRVTVDRNLCNNCMKCIDACFTGALDRFGVYYNVDELFEIVKRDEQYYASSGGGVTIGGGEPSLQHKFVRALLGKCKEHHIHTALDTCGFTTSAEAQKALEEADMLLFDIKGLDLAQHIIDTSVPNQVILSNLIHMSDIGKPIIIRLPIIPGHTDSPENILKTAELLSGLSSIQRVDLMAYHEYGTVKYSQLGREYKLNLPRPSDEHLNEIKAVMERHGLNVQLGG